MVACEAVGIAPVVPVDSKGLFTTEVPDYVGQLVFDANKPIIADLKAGTGPLARVPADQRSVLVRHETYEHSYPHCWRCRNPLIYKAVTSWFVRVSDFRDRMVELNQDITWTPEHIKDGQFGKWLSNARDWSISRNRYWGTPIPVWVSDDPAYPRVDVYGSLAELEADFGRVPTNEAGEPDLHRPFIDELTRPNPDDPTGASTMRRIPDVLDVWFDSGSMPFAQVHYPFENADWFEHHYPGDFIVEYIGQTRGWFYTLHVLATALFDRPAFRNCMCHGIVLGDDGRKASKSLRNFPDPVEMWDVYGSDAVRWFLMSSSILRGGNLIVGEEGIRDGVRQVLLPLWSTYYFFALYAGAADSGAGYTAKPVDAARAADARAHGPVRPGAHAGPRGAHHGAAGCLRHRGRVRDRARAPRRADQLVRPHAAGPVLGRGRRRVRHALDLARGAHARHGAARAAGVGGGLAGPDRRAQRAPDRLADGGRRAPRTTRSSPRWTRCARSRRPRSACARPPACASGSRCTRSPSRSTTRTPSRRTPTCSRPSSTSSASTWSRPTPAPPSASASRSASR